MSSAKPLPGLARTVSRETQGEHRQLNKARSQETIQDR
jgi:hypothetical protein